MSLLNQYERLKSLGVTKATAYSDAELRAVVIGLADQPGAVLVVHPSLLSARELTGFLLRADKPGFVVTDLTDLAEFTPVAGVEIPDSPLYALTDVQRGDQWRNFSPAEAEVEIAALGRTPLTISEGISWLLQQPEQLADGHCFMTIGSRKPKPSGKGVDSRTPAIWISRGTGRDGPENRNAPKVGWCWANNRHSWLGFASAASRG